MEDESSKNLVSESLAVEGNLYIAFQTLKHILVMFYVDKAEVINLLGQKRLPCLHRPTKTLNSHSSIRPWEIHIIQAFSKSGLQPKHDSQRKTSTQRELVPYFKQEVKNTLDLRTDRRLLNRRYLLQLLRVIRKREALRERHKRLRPRRRKGRLPRGGSRSGLRPRGQSGKRRLQLLLLLCKLRELLRQRHRSPSPSSAPPPSTTAPPNPSQVPRNPLPRVKP